VEQTVLQRVAAGDGEAVRECLDEYGGLVWSLARRFLSNRQDAEDAVQDIFVSVWQSAGRYDPSVGSESTFIAMIARRRLIDRLRRSKLDEVEFDEAAGEGERPTTGHAIAMGDDVRRAEEAIGHLSQDQQKVLRLSLIQGLSHEKIATATGLPLGTVKTHVRRGLIKLRERLQTEAEESASASGGAGQ
jgi:RNA polymerase sigma-70 factor (ECF subfamily)